MTVIRAKENSWRLAALISRLDIEPGLAGKVRAAARQADWAQVYQAAFAEGLAGLMLANRLLVPPLAADLAVFWQGMDMRHGRAARKTLAQLAAGEGACRLLAERGIPALALKGLALAPAYPHPLARSMGDADILVERARFVEACQALASQGYQPVDAAPAQALANPPGSLASVDLRRVQAPGISLHLHHHLVNSSIPTPHLSRRVDLEDVFAQAAPARFALRGREVAFFRPADHHFLLHLLEHLMRPGHGLDRLVLAADIERFLLKNGAGLDYEALGRAARAWGWKETAAAALNLAASLYGFSPPEGLARALGKGSAGVGTRLFMALGARGKRRRGLSVMAHFSLAPGLAGKLDFIRGLVAPDSGVLSQRRGIGQSKGYVGLLVGRYLEIMLNLCQNMLDSAKKLFKR